MADGFLGKLKVLIGIEEIEEEFEEDYEEESIKAVPIMERKPMDVRNSYVSPRMEPKEIKDSRVIAMQNKMSASFKMVVTEPNSFDDCPKLVDNLKSNKPIIINLEKIESETARKIFDFLSGATYALDGTMQKVANNIFVFAPENVDVDANIDQKGTEGSIASNSPWR